MRLLLRAVLPALLAVLLLTGMGQVGGAPNGTVPQTKEDIRAAIVDRQGVKTEVNRFSAGGQVFLEGARGNGRMTVDFRNLVAIDFAEPAGEEVAATLVIRTGEKLPLRVRKGTVFFGSTSYGTYQIQARDVRRIEFP